MYGKAGADPGFPKGGFFFISFSYLNKCEC